LYIPNLMAVVHRLIRWHGISGDRTYDCRVFNNNNLNEKGAIFLIQKRIFI